MAVLCTAAVLSLLSLTAAAPYGCEDALTPQETVNRSQIFGKWFLIGGACDCKKNQTNLRNTDNFWMEILVNPRNDKIFLNVATKINGSCHFYLENIEIAKASLLFDPELDNVLVHLYKCPNCLLMKFSTTKDGKAFHRVQLWARTRNLSVAELDAHKRRMECFGLGSLILKDPDTDLCPNKMSFSSKVWSMKHQLTSETPLRCENLLRPQHPSDPTQVSGNWFLVATADNNSRSSMAEVESVWMKMLPTLQNSTFCLNIATKKYIHKHLPSGATSHEGCEIYRTNRTIAHSTITSEVSSSIDLEQHVMELLSWSNFLLLKFSHNIQGKMIVQLQIWGRTRTLSKPVMDMFRRHVDCLDLGLPVYMDPEKDLCSEEGITSPKEDAATHQHSEKD